MATFTEDNGRPLDLRSRDLETIVLTSGIEISVGNDYGDGASYSIWAPIKKRWVGLGTHVMAGLFGAKELRHYLASELEDCDPADCEADCWDQDEE